MTIHTLFPAYVRLTYSGINQPHHAVLPVKDDGAWTPGNEPNLLDAVGGTHTLSDFIADYLAVFKPLFAPATVFSTVEAFLFDNPTEGSLFVFGKTLTGEVGTSSDPRLPRGEIVLTMRTALGNPMRAVGLEHTFSPDQRASAASFSGVIGAWRDYFLSDTCCIFGRDEQRAIFPLNVVTKENDALRKQAGI